MNNDFDIRDLLLEASAEVQEIIRDVMKEIQLPIQKSMGRKVWMQSADEEKEQLYSEFGSMKDLIK